MFTKLFVVICLSLCMNYSFGKLFNDDYIDQSNDNKLQEIVMQFENKMKTLFSVWKTETNQKLDVIEQMIPDLEENINRKLNILKNSILNKLEEYIDSKLNHLEKLNQNVNCNSDVLDKKAFEAFENNMNLKFDILAGNITMKLQENINRSPDVLKKVEEVLNKKFEVLDKKIPVKIEENISTRLDAVARNLTNKFEEKYNCTLENKKATEENEPPQSDENENEFPGEVTNVTHTLDAPAITESIPHKTELPCKEESLSSNRYTPDYSVYNETLQHVTVQRDSAGRLTHFELHVALQADGGVAILLKDKVHSDICHIYVGWESNQYTDLYVPGTRVQRTHTPDILSSTQFRSFYIKVDDGTLQFGKEGDSTPLVSHYYAGLGSLEYFSFYYSGGTTSKIRYDCPHVPESS